MAPRKTYLTSFFDANNQLHLNVETSADFIPRSSCYKRETLIDGKLFCTLFYPTSAEHVFLSLKAN